MALPIAVLLSGGGSNLQAIIDRVEQGSLDVDIRLVLSNKADAYGLVRARQHGLATRVLLHADYPDRAAFDRAMVAAIREAGADTVVLAGFMRLLGSEFIRSFKHVLNIHPALLPAFPGLHAQQQAADYGVRLAGCTVHFVDELVDNGPIIIQAALPTCQAESGDDLAARILRLEHRIYPQAIHWLAQGRLDVSGRHIALTGQAPKTDIPLPEPCCIVCPELESGF